MNCFKNHSNAKDRKAESDQRSEQCRAPERRADGKKKGIWARYLERLNKATGGRAIKCH